VASTYEQLGIEISVNVDQAMQSLQRLQAVLDKFDGQLGKLVNTSSKASSSIDNVSKSFKGFDFGQISKIHLSIAELTTRLTEFYSVRKVIFTVGAEFKGAFQEILHFNQALHDTAAIANASQAQMQTLSDAALQIARNSKFSATEVMKSMKELAQAGVSATDLPDVARTVDFMATGTGSTLQQAVSVMTTSLNVWNIEAEKSGRISNTLTAALNASKLEIGQLATALNYLANQSAIFDKSLEETTAIVGTLANQGVQASTIGTGVSQLMVKLAAPSDKLRALLKEFGIGLDEISPRANSFADIVARFEQAAIPAERILGAMDVRVGRMLVNSLQAGSDKFRLMEARITKTNAAAVAYNEAMKGTEAQINQLRGEAVQTLSVTLDNLGVSFHDLKENLQDLVVGLRSAEGQFILFSTAGVTAITALSRAIYSNPIMAGITATIVATGWAVSKFGETNRELANDIDKATKASAEQSAEYQRKSDALSNVLSLVDKNKTTEQGYLVVQDQNLKGLRKIMNEFPDLFKGLDIKKLKYSELTEIIRKYNEERTKELRNDILTSNAKADEINSLKTQLAESQKSEENSTSVWNFQQFQTARLRDQLKLAQDSYKKMIAANLAPRADVEITIDAQGTQRARQITPPADKPRGQAVVVPEKESKGKSPEERAEDTLSRLTEDQKALADKLTAEKAKIDREAGEQRLKDKTLTETQYHDQELQALTLLDQEYIEKQVKERTDAYTKLAKALEGTYTAPNADHPTGLISYASRFDGDAVKALIDQTNRNLNFQSSVVDAAAKEKERQKILQMNQRQDRLTSTFAEKSADKELTARTQALNLSEKLVWTETQLRQITLDKTDAEIKNAEEKRKAYEADLRTLGERARLTNDEKAAYDAIAEKLDAIKLKQQALNATRAEQAGGNQAAFMGGVRAAWLQESDSFKASGQLGNNITTTAVDGLTNSLTGMTDALARGGNAWTSFSHALSKTMVSIAQELQQYVARLMVVWAVEKMVGLFTSSTSSAWSPSSSDLGKGNYSGALQIDPMFRAGGGYIPDNIGIKGMDSIPAMLTPGEFVVKASSVRAIGVDYLNRVNAQRFADGGLVGSSSSSLKSGSGKPTVINFQLINVADASSIPPQPVDAQQVINIVAFDAARRGQTFKTFKAIVNG
jgi:TP901 family phage tail tape measure protein